MTTNLQPASQASQSIIYSPETRLKDSLFDILIHFFQEFRRTRWQIWVTFKRDFVSRYNQTMLGFAWSIILPLIPITTYVLLAYVRVLKTADNMPFVVYIVVGMTVWTFLSGTLMSPIDSLQRNKTVLESSRYPMLAVILSNFGQMIYEMMVRIAFVVIVLIYFQISLSWTIIFLPVLVLPLALFSLGLGMSLAIMNIIVRDIYNIVQVIIRYAIFLSSVIFPMADSGIAGMINWFNPFNTYVNAIRDFIVFGSISNLTLYGITSLIAIVIFLVGCKILYAMEPRIKGYL